MNSITFGDFTSGLSDVDAQRLQQILYGIESREFRPCVPQLNSGIAECVADLRKATLNDRVEEPSVSGFNCDIPADGKATEAKTVNAPAKPASWAALVASSNQTVRKVVVNEPVRKAESVPSTKTPAAAPPSNGVTATVENCQAAPVTFANGNHVEACEQMDTVQEQKFEQIIDESVTEGDVEMVTETEFDPYLEQLKIDLAAAESAVQRELEQLDVSSDRTASRNRFDTQTQPQLERSLFDNIMMPCSLRNIGSTCYANSVLQALFNTGMFVHVLRGITVLPSLRDTSVSSVSSTSTRYIDALIELGRNFQNDLVIDNDREALSHTKIKEVLRAICIAEPRELLRQLDRIFPIGRQHDAEEFYTYLINEVHDEMVAVAKRGSRATENDNRLSTVNTNNAEDTDSDWFCVDGRRTVVMRDAVARAQRDSPVSRIFSGLIRNTFTYRESSNAAQRDCDRSANVQPFFCLQLDLNSNSPLLNADSPTQSVSKALNEVFTKESVEEGGCVSRMSLDRLPAVLVLHVKCFAYVCSSPSRADVVKLFQSLAIDTELHISASFLTGTARQQAKSGVGNTAAKRNTAKHAATYRIRSIIFHHGTKLENGHYTCIAYHDTLSNWLHFDDDAVRVVRSEDALCYWRTWPSTLLNGKSSLDVSANLDKQTTANGESQPILTRGGPRMPYLLFYERVD